MYESKTQPIYCMTSGSERKHSVCASTACVVFSVDGSVNTAIKCILGTAFPTCRLTLTLRFLPVVLTTVGKRWPHQFFVLVRWFILSQKVTNFLRECSNEFIIQCNKLLNVNDVRKKVYNVCFRYGVTDNFKRGKCATAELLTGSFA